MKIDASQYEWIQKKLTGGSLGGDIAGQLASSDFKLLQMPPIPESFIKHKIELEKKMQQFTVAAKEEKQSGLSGCSHSWTNQGLPDGSIKRICVVCLLQEIIVPQCDHVWVTAGSQSHCAKCGTKPVKVDDILGAKAALEEKKYVLGYKAAQILYYNKKTLEKLKQQTPLGNYQNTQNAQQNASQSQSLSGELGGLGGSGYGYQTKFSESLKTIWTDPNEGFTGAGDAEKFVIKIAMLTNMNVNLQGKGYGFNKKYRLKCDKCGSIQEVPREIADKYDSDASVIADFCKTHKHIVEPKEVRGRKFREAV